MVNAPVTFDARASERALALSYAPADRRVALATLFALDDMLGSVLRTTREPLVGQMRLTWWNEALGALDAGPPPAEPLLQALARTVLPLGVGGAELASLTDGWEALLAEPPDLSMVAEMRGERLFHLAARLLDAADAPARIEAAGRAWTMNDVALHLRDTRLADAARTMASSAWQRARPGRWSRAARPIGALVLLAASDLAGTVPGSPARIGRLALLRLAGR